MSRKYRPELCELSFAAEAIPERVRHGIRREMNFAPYDPYTNPLGTAPSSIHVCFANSMYKFFSLSSSSLSNTGTTFQFPCQLREPERPKNRGLGAMLTKNSALHNDLVIQICQSSTLSQSAIPELRGCARIYKSISPTKNKSRFHLISLPPFSLIRVIRGPTKLLIQNSQYGCAQAPQTCRKIQEHQDYRQGKKTVINSPYNI
jgi:hypothetical protein